MVARISLAELDVALLRSQLSCVFRMEVFGTNSKSRKFRLSFVNSDFNWLNVFLLALLIAVATIRSRRVIPGRTILSLISLSHEMFRSSNGFSCSRARSTIHSDRDCR